MAVTEAVHSTDLTNIPPFIMPLVSPSALLQAHLSQDPPTRPSGRSPTQTRPINLNTGSLTHCNGSSVVRVGESTIVCGIRAEVLPVSDIPYYRVGEYSQDSVDTEQEDNHKSYEAITLNHLLVPNLELSTNAHPSFSVNVAPSVTAQSMSQRILSLLHTSRLIRVADLEIRHTSSITSDLDPDDPAYVEPEKNVLKAFWVLYIDCVCLSYGGEGNMFDTSVLAAVAALRDLSLPQTRWDEDQKRIFCNADMSAAKQLRLKSMPTPLSFGVFIPDTRLDFSQVKTNGMGHGNSSSSTKDIVLVDMDAFEDNICEEKGCVVVDSSSDKPIILRIEKAGGSGSFGVERMKELIFHADKRWKEWKVVLDAALQANG